MPWLETADAEITAVNVEYSPSPGVSLYKGDLLFRFYQPNEIDSIGFAGTLDGRQFFQLETPFEAFIIQVQTPETFVQAVKELVDP